MHAQPANQEGANMNTLMNIAGALLASLASLAAWAQGGDAEIRHGRYLIQTSGCNDCHTPGYMQKDGQVTESEWLTGDAMGWHGPWGAAGPAGRRRRGRRGGGAAGRGRGRRPM